MVTDTLEREIEDARSRLGEELRADIPWVTVATPQAIRRFAIGNGDDNPLWCDRVYAETSRFGAITAPPHFVQAADSGDGNLVLTNYPGLYMGARFTFHEPVHAHARITVTAVFADLEVRQTRDGAPLIFCYHDHEYRDHDGTLLSEARHIISRVPGQLGATPPPPGDPHRYAREELEALAAEAAAFPRRGAAARRAEDVEVGDTIGPLLYGPLTGLDFSARMAQMGFLRPIYTLDAARAQVSDRATGQRHPLMLVDGGGAYVHPARAHLDERMARKRGMAGPFDYGLIRQAWAARLLTDWAGDGGWLAEIDVQIRRPIVVGDVLRLSGEVVGHGGDDAIGRVEVKITGTNQRGDTTTAGSAVVELPRRGAS